MMDDSWEDHKDRLRMLYCSTANGGTLKSIMDHMRVKYNFIKRYVRRFFKCTRMRYVIKDQSDAAIVNLSTSVSSRSGTSRRTTRPRSGATSTGKLRNDRRREKGAWFTGVAG